MKCRRYRLKPKANAEQQAIGNQQEMIKNAQEFEQSMAEKAAEHELSLDLMAKTKTDEANNDE